MQSIILAAGMGKRLKELTHDNTKCMVQVCGETLIERMLKQQDRLNLERIVIVVGYQGRRLIDFVSWILRLLLNLLRTPYMTRPTTSILCPWPRKGFWRMIRCCSSPTSYSRTPYLMPWFRILDPLWLWWTNMSHGWTEPASDSAGTMR